MTKEEQFFARRLLDMAEHTYISGCPGYSDFLNLNEQDIFFSIANQLPPVEYSLFGGHVFSERKLVGFLPADKGISFRFPVCAIRCTPENRKFAEPLTHRDYLGALMNMGIKRSTLGDFLFTEDCSYIICLDKIADYIAENLTKVKHTTVCAIRTPLDDIICGEPKIQEVTGFVSSNRLDSIIAVAYSLSRRVSADFILGGSVFVNSRQVTSVSHSLKEKDIVSVRGKGRFQYNGIIASTKKQRKMISLAKYE